MRSHRGFTLIELMIALAIAAILLAVALPSYRAYVQRSRTPVALDALSAYATRMEQRYQDSGNYGTTTAGCSMSPPSGVANFTVTCAITNSGQGYTATATGAGTMYGYAYTITEAGARATTAHPNGANTTCCTTKGSVCDT